MAKRALERKKHELFGSTGYKGVSKYGKSDTYRAYVTFPMEVRPQGRPAKDAQPKTTQFRYQIGSYPTAQEAHQARIDFINRLL